MFFIAIWGPVLIICLQKQGCRRQLLGGFLCRSFIQGFDGPEVQGFGRTGGYAGRFFSFLYPVHTQMAFLHAAVVAELRNAEWACQLAGVAADTFVLVDDHNAVGRPLVDGAGGAGHFAGRNGAVQAGMGNASVHHLGKLPFPDIENPSPSDTRFDVVQTLAGHLAGVALHATLGFKVDSILFLHLISPLLLF